jgi:hypothetical protein
MRMMCLLSTQAVATRAMRCLYLDVGAMTALLTSADLFTCQEHGLGGGPLVHFGLA